MNKEEELNYMIRAEYILLRHFERLYEYSESDRAKVEKEFNKHLREYKDLTGNDFQLEKITNKLDPGYG